MNNFAGFYIFKVGDDDELPLELDVENALDAVVFGNLRQVSKRLSLEPGIYVIVPCTGEADIEAEFMLRVFTETPSKLRDVPTHVKDLLKGSK